MGVLNSSRKAMKGFIEKSYSMGQLHGEMKKINDPRRQNLIETVHLTKAEENKIDTLFVSTYGKKIKYDWHRLYQSFTGKFDENYFPEYLFSSVLEPKMNPMDYRYVLDDKLLLPLFCVGVDHVRTPRTYYSVCDGICFDEEKNINKVLDKLEEPEITEIADILVMNDASSDNTNWIVKQRNHAVVTHIFNLGYGSALQLGYKYAIRRNYKYVIQMDADGQHDVCNILNIYKALKTKYNDSYPDIVLGSRYLKDSSPYKTSFLKEVAYSIFRTFIKMSTGRTIMDPTTGLQGLSWRAVLYYSKYGNFDERYPDANMITGMILKGYNVVEIPAVMHSREFGKSMHSGLKPIWYMCHMTLSLIAVVVRQHKEKRRMERQKKHEQ